MTSPVLKDVTWLFRRVVEWYHANPDKPLPDDQWAKYSTGLLLNDEMIIYIGETAITLQNAEVIPLIASVALGHSRQQVLKVINDHWFHPHLLSNAWFKDIAKNDPKNNFRNFFSHEPNKWQVCHEYIQSISQDDETAREFMKTLVTSRDQHELSVACLLSQKPSLWPVTELTRIMESPTQARYKVPTPTCLEAFLWKSINLDLFSDDQILTMLERSGNFIEGMEEENGLPNNFFFNLMTHNDITLGVENRNKARILSVINTVADPEQKNKIERLIISELTAHDFHEGVTEGVMFFNSLLKSLDPLIYPKVFDSLLLKVNATSVYDLSFIKAINPEEIPTEALKDILNDPETLLSKLKAEFDDLAPGDYRAKHFKALKRLFSDYFVPQKLDAIDLNQLIQSTVKGFDAYITATHISGGGFPSKCWKDQAAEDMSLFLSKIIPHMVIDYKGFTKLCADTKLLLASNGFDFKKIPDMTRHDRGRLLSDQLGL